VAPGPVTRSIFTRTFAGIITAVVAALLVVALAVPQLAESVLLAVREQQLLSRGSRARAVAAAYLEGTLTEEAARELLADLGGGESPGVWLVDGAGNVLLGGQVAEELLPGAAVPGGGGRRHRGVWNDSEARSCLLAGDNWSSREALSGGEVETLTVGVPVLSSDGSRVLGGLYLDAGVADISATVDLLRERLFMAAGVGLAVSVALAAVISRTISRPVGRMTRMARRMAEGDFDLRAPTGPDEVGRLGHALNTMAGRLKEARERSRRLERTRRELVANVSHDLRSPVAAIRGFVEPLLDGTVEDENTRRKYLETIRSEAEALGTLVDDLMELSRLEAGAESLRLGDVDLGQLVEETVARYRIRAREAGVDLKADVGTLPGAVRADESRVARVLRNLLDNALKFTPPGGTVRVRAVEAGSEMSISVEDTGPGIDPADLPHVFDRFFKADRARSRRGSGRAAGSTAPEGSGLGLAIVKQIAEAHGGRVEVESRLGRGTRITVRLPAVFEEYSNPLHEGDTSDG